MKNRIGYSMIETAERAGLVKEDTINLEPTSGNTGIALAFICAAKGYPLVLTMPDTMSAERIHLLRMFGTKVILTMERGDDGCSEMQRRWLQRIPDISSEQLENPANPDIHGKTTVLEIGKILEDKSYFSFGCGNRRNDYWNF